MTTHHKAAKKFPLSTVAGASMLLLGLTLTGCSTASPETAAETSGSSATQTASAPSTAAQKTTDVVATTAASSTAPAAKPSEGAKPAEAAAVKDRTITMHVEGANSQALVKALIVTADGKETGGEMVTETLPFNQDVTLPADSVFTKVLVLGKYADGATGEISCSITIDGVEVASRTSTNHKPAECLFVEKAAK